MSSSKVNIPKNVGTGTFGDWQVPGVGRDAALHNQLYRYAEDLQQMIERHGELESRFQMLQASYQQLGGRNDLVDELISGSADIHIVTDADGIVLSANSAATALAPSCALEGTALAEWISPSSQAAYFRMLERASSAGAALPSETELRMYSGDTQATSLIVSVQVLRLTRGHEDSSLHWIMRDVTRLREKEFETQLTSMVFKHTAEGVMITDVTGVILSVNPAFSRITGFSAEEAIGKTPRILKSGAQDDFFYAELWGRLETQGSWEGEVCNRRKNGETYVEWLTINAVRDRDGQILSYIAVFSDLSRLIQAEKRLSHIAHHDALTGLPNRLLLQERLAQTISQSRRSNVPLVVIFVDLDRFKQVNDTLGHEVGDVVIREAAWRLTSSVREADTVARLGGDEFVILAPGLVGDEAIGVVCDKLLSALIEPIVVGEHELFIGGSFGCAEYPRHGDDDVTLLKHADVAMYQAKAAGGNTYVIYRPAHAIDNTALHIETELRHALERNQLHLVYQPQVSANTGGLQGVEALLRWDHPTLGAVPPAQFIPIAEEIGSILSIGAWVLRQACRQLAEWRAAGYTQLVMSVNVSPRQLRDPSLVDVVRRVLADTGVPPECLELEVTEAEIMYHLKAGLGRLTPLRELGVRISIDDFGTGYSSLARLRELPISGLKIDRSFMVGLEGGNDPHAAAISAAIIAMGRALGLELVAEGVESQTQLDILAKQGCDSIQGFLTGRPMSPAAFLEWAVDPGLKEVIS